MNNLKSSVDDLNESLKYQNIQNNVLSSQISNLNDSLNQTATNSAFEISSYETFLNNIGSSFSNIQSTFEETKNILDGGFTFDTSKYSSYTDCTMSTIAFGQNISIDYCSAFVPFKTFITFLITMVLIYHSIKIFIWGLK